MANAVLKRIHRNRRKSELKLRETIFGELRAGAWFAPIAQPLGKYIKTGSVVATEGGTYSAVNLRTGVEAGFPSDTKVIEYLNIA